MEAAAAASASTTVVATVSETTKSSHTAASRGGGGKKKAGRPSTKRRKATTAQSTDGPDSALAVLPYRQISSARALLAAEALDALKMCLRSNFDDLPSLTKLQALLRDSVSTEHMRMLVDLEDNFLSCLPGRLLLQRVVATFRPKLVRSSHMSMCICLGRGRMSSRRGESHGLLNKKRLNLFKRISSNTLSSTPGTGKRWPLWLPPSLKAVVASNVATETRVNAKDAEADRFIVEGAIAMITHMLNQIALFPRTDTTTEVVTAYDPVYLSLADTRIILTALIHLPQDVRAALFASLIEAVSVWFNALTDGAEIARICNDPEVSGFVARVVALCSNAYSLLRFGTLYRRELKEVLNAAQTPPQLVMQKRGGYSSEQSFSGVLENWEFVDESHIRFSLEEVDGASEMKLQSMLESAFHLGFKTASVDRCHLLFAAWNALGKCEIWSPITAVKPLPRDIATQVSSVIIDLRNDLCFVHRLVGRAVSRDLAKSSLVHAIEERETRSSTKTKSEWASLAREALSTMVNKAATIVKRAENELFVDGQDMKTAAFCLLELLPTYVAFAVSALTRPRANFFSSTYDQIVNQSSNKRGRGYSSESENTASDEESHESQDFSLSAYERLQDVCDVIGAVPAHPDWLDKECRLLDGVTYAFAVDVAHKAQLCMTELLAMATRQAKLNQASAVEALCTEARQRQEPAAKLAVDLCWLHYPMMEALDGPPDYDDEQSVLQCVGKVCRVEHKVFEKIHQQVGERRDTPGIQFCKTAAQRVQGRLTSMFRTGTAANYASGPELRATEEWEVLLARSLTLAGTDEMDPAAEFASIQSQAMVANGWQAVLWSAVENLSPITALLRFGLSQRGRDSHPLSSNDFSVDDYDASDSSLADDLPSGTVVSTSVERSVLETLAALSFVLPDDLACSAAAMHLLPDMASYLALKNIGVCRSSLGALERVHALMESRPASQRQVGIGIVERLASVIERYGSNNATEEPDAVVQHTLVLASLNMKMVEEVKTIASLDLDLAKFWSAIQGSKLVRVPGFYAEDHGVEHLLRGLVRFVWHEGILASENARVSLGNALCRLLWHEYEGGEKPLLLMVCNLANQSSESNIEALLRSEIVGKPDAPATKSLDLPLKDSRSVMCSVLSLVVSTSKFTKSNIVVRVLLDSLSVWGALEWDDRLLVLNLLFLHASVVGQLHVVGERFIASLQENEKNVENFSHFCTFVAALQSVTKGGDGGKPQSSSGATAKQTIPSLCSYAMFADFREQHWYHCYTCDLTGDRGCCTLCALSCHRGHDVVYARHSSFFCDCGAEESGSNCRSLSRLDPSAIESIRQHWSRKGSSGSSNTGLRPLDLDGCTKLATTSHMQESKGSIKAFHDAAQPSEWTDLVFKYMASEFSLWTSANAVSSRMPTQFLGYYRSNLSRRLATRPCVVLSSDSPFQSLRSLRDGSIRSLSSAKRTFLRDKGICRHVLEANSRGHLAVADADNVLFCNGMSQISGEGNGSYLQRSSLYILKSVPVYFEIIGLRFSTSAESTVAVWGSNSVTILEMSSSFSTVERRTDLVIDLKALGGSSDSVIQCHWLRGSCLAVGCRQAILVYDLDQSEKTPQVTIRPPETENELADFSVVRLSSSPTTEAWRIFVLFKDGRLQGIRLSESTLVGPKTLMIPDEGLGIMLASSPNESPELSEDIQCGTRLSFLRQSRTLVYQGSKEVYGIPVSSEGEIDRAFVLLPQSLSLPGVETPNCISGPYTQWTDLGLVERGECVYFRVSCVADYVSKGQPALLIVDFNQSDTKVLKVWSESGGQESPFHRKFSIDGCAAFSAPFLSSTESSGRLEVAGAAEKVFIAVVSSKGTLQIFSEESTPCSRPSVEPFVNRRGEVLKAEAPRIEPQIPLLAFESLINVTDTVELFLKESVESVTSDEIKTNLQRDNDLYLRSPDCDGFTLNIATGPADNASARHSKAITAVRVLFGSSCFEGIPKYVTVQGKQYPILPDTKRWYAFHLSAQDVLLAIRSGVISIHISASHDSSTRPIMDALETYATDRTEIDRSLPTSMRRLVAPCGLAKATTKVSSEDTHGSSRLRLCLVAMASLNGLLGHRRPSQDHMALLEKLVKATALDLDRNLSAEVVSLVSSFESSIDDPQAFLDCGAISCCAEFLSECSQALTSSASSGSEEDCSQFWQGLRSEFRACLRVAAGVARLRPKNYLKAIADYPQSIAVRAGSLMDVLFIQSSLNGDAVSDFVELSLLESAVARGYGADYDARGRFAGFDILHRLLVSPNNLIVQFTCSAISKFCEKYSLVERLGNDEVDLFAEKPMIEYYECDGCGLFPIVDTRYSLNDEDRPIDLCGDCFRMAKDFAASKGFDDSQDVVIRGRTLGEGPSLTCSEVGTMEVVPIRNSNAADTGDSTSETGQGRNNAREKESSTPGSSQAEVFQRQQLFDEFMDGLFSMIISLLSTELERQELFVSALLSLVFQLTRCSDNGGKKTDRASRLARKLVEGLSRLMQRYLSRREDGQATLRKLEICIVRYLMALSTLVVPDDNARQYLIYPNTEMLLPDEELDSSEQRETLKCEHGSAAVRHVFAKGSNVDRAFYCCGMKSKAHKCNFFVWSGERSQRGSVYNENIAKLIWTFISQPQSKDAPPLCSSICSLVKTAMERTDLFSAGAPQSRTGSAQLERRQKNIHRTLADFSDGVWCGRERLQSAMVPYVLTRGPKSARDFGLAHVEHDIVDASLELMALVAQPDAPGGVSDWFSPLCLVLLSQREGTTYFQPQAKRALWQLCGKAPEKFTAVRDSHLFKMQFEEVSNGARSLRDYCLLVNQKAEQQVRHQRRNDTPKLTSQDLRLRDVVGAVDLMNEDVSLRDLGTAVEKALDELLSIAKKRRGNWKKFCFSDLSGEGVAGKTIVPVDELLVLSCLLSGDLQMKAMELASLAVPPRSVNAATTKFSSSSEAQDREEEPASHELGPRVESAVECDDLYAFVFRFVCSEESQDIRRLAVKVAVGLCELGNFASDLLVRLTKTPMALVGSMGKLSFDFLVLMNELVAIAQPTLVDVDSLASTVSLLFQKQTLAARFDRSNGESFHFETRSSASIQKNRFELARCAHVVLRHSPATRSTNSKNKRLPEQVSPFVRMHLEMGRSSASSNEFNSFTVLPYRCVISEIHVDASDQRGRYVKKINFYCSPRPVKSPSRLKAPEYSSKWQLCGSLELPRAAEKATCTLKRPVLASNLRIEYAEFYDRPGSPKSDGFVVHCPRCTRIVTNAHGVCASCGEVAFQCRRCRHINYDRLDAYLCVECGFIQSGSFSYDITCGIASNAIAISNDHDYRHATNMFSTASWLFEEIRGVLRQKLTHMSDRSTRRSDFPIGGSDSLKRALEGKLPLLPGGKEEQKTDPAQSLLKRFNKRGSIVKLVARKGSSRSSSTQNRSDSTSTIRIIRSHRGGGENSNNAGEEEDEEALASDLLGGLLESAGMARGSLDPSDPVSRFLASVHSRARERRSAATSGGDEGGGDGGSQPPASARNESGASAPQTSRNKMFEECERLYRLMHEAQRECFALERRLEAWRRLESGNLCFHTGQQHSDAATFEPSHCSTCSGVVSHQLLILWQSLFSVDPAKVEVSKDMLALLLSDDPSTSTRALQESKLSAAKDIALRSKKYRPMVLEALRSRLLPLGDVHCAEILGMILKEGTDISVVEPFVALAREAMESNPVV